MWYYLFAALAGAALIYLIMAIVFTWKYLSYVRSRRQWFLDNPEQVAIVRAQRMRLKQQQGNGIVAQSDRKQATQNDQDSNSGSQ